MLERVKLASDGDVRKAWDFFDTRLDRDSMDRLLGLAFRLGSLEKVYEIIMECTHGKLDNAGMPGREYLAMCIECAVRQQSQ